MVGRERFGLALVAAHLTFTDKRLEIIMTSIRALLETHTPIPAILSSKNEGYVFVENVRPIEELCEGSPYCSCKSRVPGGTLLTQYKKGKHTPETRAANAAYMREYRKKKQTWNR